jgi:hypothetical protein
MRIGPTAAMPKIRLHPEWGKAKPWPSCRDLGTGKPTSPMSSPIHPGQAFHLNLRKTSPGSISA